jgi:hypothetical protein
MLMNITPVSLSPFCITYEDSRCFLCATIASIDFVGCGLSEWSLLSYERSVFSFDMNLMIIGSGFLLSEVCDGGMDATGIGGGVLAGKCAMIGDCVDDADLFAAAGDDDDCDDDDVGDDDDDDDDDY